MFFDQHSLLFIIYKRHNASTWITSETHTHSAQYEGGLLTPDQIEGTPAMDLGLGTDHVRRYRGMCVYSTRTRFDFFFCRTVSRKTIA